jgi:hypothetical protein
MESLDLCLRRADKLSTDKCPCNDCDGMCSDEEDATELDRNGVRRSRECLRRAVECEGGVDGRLIEGFNGRIEVFRGAEPLIERVR